MKKFFSLIAAFMLLKGGLVAMDKKVAEQKLEKAVFAGGCFWCMQTPFDKLKGVVQTVVGYTGGTKTNPTYEEVSAGGTGHAEAIEISFDPSTVSYEQVLDVFWHNIDPTTPNRQFCDSGDQYRAAIFYYGDPQKKLAESTKGKWEKSEKFGHKIVTEIAPGSVFYPAEDYHQKYYVKNPIRYKLYRFNCGRDQYLEKIWGKSTH